MSDDAAKAAERFAEWDAAGAVNRETVLAPYGANSLMNDLLTLARACLGARRDLERLREDMKEILRCDYDGRNLQGCHDIARAALERT